MNVNSSQSIQSSHPLGSISSRRVNDVSQSSNVNADAEDKQVEREQQRRDQRILSELRARDREVRAHEAAHAAVGGSLVRGGPSYTLQRGPDGRSYAIGGEVQLDTSAVANDPEATLQKSNQIRAAALAPAEPSPQDLSVAANANQMAARARVDIAVQRRNEAQEANQNRLDEASNSSETEQSGADDSGNAVGEVSASQVNPNQSIEAATSSDSLQSNEPPAAALSNFMATAQSEPAPVRLNQFV